MKQESKKTAIITGSSRGIGKETAIILAKKVSECSYLL
jgi:NAD(P)-dependent dehydrogenase (short-subunit alcohol dehydrogenase family)